MIVRDVCRFDNHAHGKEEQLLNQRKMYIKVNIRGREKGKVNTNAFNLDI